MRHRERTHSSIVRHGAINERDYFEGNKLAVMELVIASLRFGYKILLGLESHAYLLGQAVSSQG